MQSFKNCSGQISRTQSACVDSTCPGVQQLQGLEILVAGLRVDDDGREMRAWLPHVRSDWFEKLRVGSDWFEIG